MPPRGQRSTARLPDLRVAYDAQQALLVQWLADLPAAAWRQPTRLAGWTVHDLAFHTTEVPRALTRAIAEPRPTARALRIAEYTAHWASAADEIAARDRGAAGDLTPAQILDRHAAEHAALHAALDETTGDPAIAARRGPIKLSDFLATRINELVVHGLDLAAAVPDQPAMPLDRRAAAVSCRMLAGILAERVPGRSVELRVPPYVAVQCVAGPRHTRGTPPNVVEVEPVGWIELATGRLDWTAAVDGGAVRASGERSDLSAYLPVLS
ncbi:MAG TPA: sterol carrier family protein [Mycobacteriales bacterium]|nr:sterol carrier family protein [Mycobacteriales bacterium]